MRNTQSKITMSGRQPALAARSDMMWLPCIGGQAGSINLSTTSPITKGYPTKIVLQSSPTCYDGQYVGISSVVGMTEINGYHKVLYHSGGELWLDTDSSAYSDWTSGGAMNFDVLFDRCGNLAPAAIQGTTAGIWANPADGMTTHSAGTNALRNATPGSLFDFSTAKFAVIGASIRLGATAAGATETIMSIGRKYQTTEASAGALCLGINGVQVELLYRPMTSGAGVNKVSSSTSLGTTARRYVAGFVDFDAGTQYLYLDGRLRDVDTFDATNRSGNLDGRDQGVCFGATIGASPTFTLSEKLGAATTPSQARVKDLFVWKPPLTMTAADVHAAIQRYHREGEWRV